MLHEAYSESLLEARESSTRFLCPSRAARREAERDQRREAARREGDEEPDDETTQQSKSEFVDEMKNYAGSLDDRDLLLFKSELEMTWGVVKAECSRRGIGAAPSTN